MSIKNTLAIALQSPPYLMLRDELSKVLVNPSVLPTGAGSDCAFSPDRTKLAVAHSSSPNVTIYNTSDWSKITNPANLPASTGNGCAFSPDSTKLAVAHNSTPFVTIYNTSDWSKITNPGTLPASAGIDCAFSPDGSKLAVAHATTPYVTIYNTSDWSKIANPSTLPAGAGSDCVFSPDGTKLAVAHSTSPYLTVYNTSDWSKIANPSNLPPSNAFGCAFSPDGSKLAIAHASSPFITVYNVSDWSKLTLSSIPVKLSISSVQAVTWLSNTICVLATDGAPGVVEIDVSTGLVSSSMDSAYGAYGVGSLSAPNWSISGTIEESLAADNWTAYVYDLVTGQLLNSATFTGTSFSVALASPDPVSVTVAANQGSKWTPSTTLTSGTKIYPTNPTATPYYYTVSTAGMTASSEPVWPITAGGTVTNGTVTFTRVERLIQPVTQSPLIPVPL